VYGYPRVKAARWNTMEVPGNFTGGVNPGMHVELWKHGKHPYPRRTRQECARDMIRHYKSLLNLRGEDADYGRLLGTLSTFLDHVGEVISAQ
jgi:hypothetical protein